MSSNPPILSLPTELLQQIFISYGISSTELSASRFVHRDFATILAAQILRTITIATPYLTADLSDLLSEKIKALISSEDLYLLRSSARVLRISNNPAIEPKSRYSHNVLRAILSALPKIESIELVLENVLETPFLSTLMEELNTVVTARRLPVDARITRLGASSRSHDPTRRSKNFLAALPPLRTLDIKGGFWGFEIAHVLAVELGHTLQRSPDITSLAIRDELRRRGGSPSLELIIQTISHQKGLEKLEKLVVESESLVHYDSPRECRRMNSSVWLKMKNLKELQLVCSAKNGFPVSGRIWEDAGRKQLFLEKLSTRSFSPKLASYLSLPEVGRSLRVLHLCNTSLLGDAGGFAGPDDPSRLVNLSTHFWSEVYPNLKETLEELILFPFPLYGALDVHDRIRYYKIALALEEISVWSLSKRTITEHGLAFPKLKKLCMFALLVHKPDERIIGTEAQFSDIMGFLEACPILTCLHLVIVMPNHAAAERLTPTQREEMSGTSEIIPLQLSIFQFLDEVMLKYSGMKIAPGTELVLDVIMVGVKIAVACRGVELFYSRGSGWNKRYPLPGMVYEPIDREPREFAAPRGLGALYDRD